MRKILIIAVLLIAQLVSAQSATVEGRVRDASGAVITGARVKLFKAEQVVSEAVTSSMGTFELSVEPGQYNLEVTASEFEPYVEMIKVTAVGRILDITLKASIP